MENGEKKESLDFFEKNEAEVSLLMCRILLWMTLIFPVFFILSALHVFKITIPELLKITPFGVICTISPTILSKFNVSVKFIKNYSIIAVSLLIMMMAANAHVGIYITYVLALSLSCLYFDRKFTIRTAVIGYVCLVVAVWLRSGGADLGDRSRVSWFIAYTMGYTMEYAAMSAVFISLAKRARQLLLNLYNTEKVREILNQCGAASTHLSSLLGNLNSAIQNTVENNIRIEDEADKTMEGCENTLKQVKTTNASIGNMKELMAGSLEQTGSMAKISEDSYQKTQNYIDTMAVVVESMQSIGQSGNMIQERIDSLSECADEIAGFTDTVERIADQTHILALNASIEAAREGEHGRGFSIIASQIRELAAESRNAAKNITEQIAKMSENMNMTLDAATENGRNVDEGIAKLDVARKEAGELLVLQEKSSSTVKAVEKNIGENAKHQDKVVEVADGMESVANNSILKVSAIKEAIAQQKRLAEGMEYAFREVDIISEKLLKISMRQDI